MNRTHAELSPDAATRAAHRDLDDEMEAGGFTNDAVAAHLGVTEKVVRKLRKGESVLTLARIYRLPPRLRAAILRRAAARFEAPAAGADTAERQANVCTGRAGELIVALSESMRDSVIDASEARALLPVVRGARGSLDALENRLMLTATREMGVLS